MSGLWALARLELLTLARDRMMLIAVVLTPLLVLLVLPGIEMMAEEEEEPPRVTAVEGAEAPAACGEGTWPALATDDADRLPRDIDWPGPFVSEAEADLRLVVEEDEAGGVPTLRLLQIDDEAGYKEARACLSALIADTRAKRFAALGLPVYPYRLAEAEVITAEQAAFELPPFSIFGFVLGLISLMVAGSLAIEAVPRRRASGLFEQLRATQTREVELVWAWVLSLVVLTSVVCVLSAIAWLITAIYYGALGNLEHGLHAVPLAAVVGAASIRTSLHAQDVQSATLRWFAVLAVLMLSTGVSTALVQVPWLAALVPLGGTVLASMGLLGGWGFLSDLAALGWTALLVGWCARSLAREEATGAGVDPALHRRAQGNYLPEVAVLTCLGLSCAVVSSAGAFGGDLWVGVTFGFVGFMLLPSLVAGPVLGLSARELLPLRRPAVRDVALSIPLTVGLFGLATVVMAASVQIIPTNGVIDEFVDGMGKLTEGRFAAIAIGLYPAICEEFLYRGVILGLLLRSGNTRRAIVIQAAAFAIAHIVSVRLPWTFVFGLVMGWIRVRTGSLWACMAVHFVFNCTAAALPMVVSEPMNPMDMGWADALYALPMLLALGVLPLYSQAKAGELDASAHRT